MREVNVGVHHMYILMVYCMEIKYRNNFWSCLVLVMLEKCFLPSELLVWLKCFWDPVWFNCICKVTGLTPVQ